MRACGSLPAPLGTSPAWTSALYTETLPHSSVCRELYLLWLGQRYTLRGACGISVCSLIHTGPCHTWKKACSGSWVLWMITWKLSSTSNCRYRIYTNYHEDCFYYICMCLRLGASEIGNCDFIFDKAQFSTWLGILSAVQISGAYVI